MLKVIKLTFKVDQVLGITNIEFIFNNSRQIDAGDKRVVEVRKGGSI